RSREGRPVRWRLHPPPRIHVFCRHVETRRKCPLTAGFSDASFESLVLRKADGRFRTLVSAAKNPVPGAEKVWWREASTRSSRCWKRAASKPCKCEDGNEGGATRSR